MLRLLIALFLSAPALAAPPPGAENSPDHAWWEGAKTSAGGSCCGAADGSLVHARLIGSVWQVWLNNVWQTVPREAVLLGYPPNPAGSAAVWVVDRSILCFVPPMPGG